MRKIVVFMHTTLDGFVAGPNGEMDWINVDEELFDFAGQQTDRADTALYGRVTYEMMDSYWPTAGDEPNASKHDIKHSQWYNSVTKVVVSKTLRESDLKNTKVISSDLSNNINKLKQQQGKNILIFGSPTTCHALMSFGLIDEFWLFVNPVVLGNGIPMFKGVENMKLKLIESNQCQSGVVGLHYLLA